MDKALNAESIEDLMTEENYFNFEELRAIVSCEDLDCLEKTIKEMQEHAEKYDKESVFDESWRLKVAFLLGVVYTLKVKSMSEAEKEDVENE